MTKILTMTLIGLFTASCSHYSVPKKEAYASKFMITTQGVASSQAGYKVIEMGGNIVDAAVAISFAISVERPQSTGLGGGGFMLMAGGPQFQKPIALDFREKAPLKSHSKMYLDAKGDAIRRKSIDGILAVGVPGLVDGLIKVHQKYGKLSLVKVMTPAIELAEKGFKIYPHLANAIQVRSKIIEKFPSTKKIFFKNNKPMKQGDWLVQKDLAKSLRLIAQNGKSAFYNGEIARSIVATSKKYNGLLSIHDFKKYNSKWRDPIKGKYKDFDVYSMSPPSSGGIHIVQMLNILEKANLGKTYKPLDAEAIHYTASAMQKAFADRAKYLGDSDFVDVPVKHLTSKSYASKIFNQIPKDRARSSQEVQPGGFDMKESNDTTHFTIMGADGTTISSTQTINGLLGSALVAEGTGIVLNNEMDDFAAKKGASNMFGAIGGNNNLVEAEKRPLSSMSPTIFMEDGEAVLALGTPNGTRIITCTLLVALNYLEYDLPLYKSVAMTRYHHQWYPDEIRIDEPGISVSASNKLKKYGYKLNKKKIGCKVQAISREEDSLHGVSDPRGEGLAIGI